MRGFYWIAGAGVLCACLAGWAALACGQPTLGHLPATDGPPPVIAPAPKDQKASPVPTPTPPAAPAPTPAPITATGGAPVPVPPPPSALLPEGPPPGAIVPASASPVPAPLPAVGPAAVLPTGPAAPAPAAPPAHQSAFPPENEADTGEAAVGRQEPAVSLEWVGSPTAKIGQPNDYTLTVRNICNTSVHKVLVQVRVPTGLTVGATEPRANTREPGGLNWQLGTLQARQERTIQMKMTAESKGDLTPRASVTFTGSTAMCIKVREPKLLVKVITPEKVMVGEHAQFTLAVSNPGDGSADQVKISAVLSEGLEHARGNRIHFEIGNLAAGETRNVALLCGTRTGGAQKCEASAEAEGGLKSSDTGSINVIVPRLDLQISGPGLRYLERKALYTLKVTNPGDAPATNVTVADTVPAGFKVLAASDGGRHDFQTRTVSWFLGEVGPGQTREVKLEVQAVGPGEHKHKATAVGARGLRALSETITRVEGVSALLVELIDTEDPIEVNGETAYEVRITNTGSKTETDIKLVAFVPDKMAFKNAQGPAHCKEEGKTIVFEPIEKLVPRADAIFRINVRTLEAGTVRFKIQVTSASMPEPVTKEEPTRIYADAPEPSSPAVRPSGPEAPPVPGPAAPPGAPAPMPGPAPGPG